jgi:hypothetical protein
MRFMCAVVLVVGMALPAQAQDDRGWSLSGSFSGSSNSSGVVTKAEPVLSYAFNKTFSTYAGLPVYMVNLSSTTDTSTTTTASNGFMSGIGNAFLGFRAGVRSEMLDYTSNLEFTAPTGDKTQGFSTGRVTVDWTNRFSRTVSSVTPFAGIGIANTVSDTAFFVRPFSSLGLVGHFEGGATYNPVRAVRLGASAYAVRGSGQQRIISRVIKVPKVTSTQTPAQPVSEGRGSGNSGGRVFETQTETVSEAAIVNDHGFSTWFGVSPKPPVDFYAGYSRSVNYDFNTIFFGVGFHLGK